MASLVLAGLNHLSMLESAGCQLLQNSPSSDNRSYWEQGSCVLSPAGWLRRVPLVMTEVEEWKQKHSKSFFKFLYRSHLLTTHWPKKFTWPNSESKGKDIEPTSLVREITKLHGTGAWI